MSVMKIQLHIDKIIKCYLNPLCLLSSDLLLTNSDIVRLITGKPCSVQGIDSEVILHVPKDVFAVLQGNIHTDPSKFLHHIPSNECLIGPICEYHLKPFEELPKDAVYRLQIPHIVRNVTQVRKHIRVRHGDLHSKSELAVYELQEDNFQIDEKYVTINIRHFSDYIVTAEGINCCSGRTNVHLFGSLTNSQHLGASAIIKIYMSSILSQIKDFKTVSK